MVCSVFDCVRAQSSYCRTKSEHATTVAQPYLYFFVLIAKANGSTMELLIRQIALNTLFHQLGVIIQKLDCFFLKCYTEAMHKSVYDKIRRQVEKPGSGSVFIPRDFLALGSRASVDEALSRLAKEGILYRLGRGLYHFPRIHPALGPIPAAPDQIASAFARKTDSRLQSAGAGAANALGLSTQVTVRPVYLTDGRRRRVQVGNHVIELRHAEPRTMAGAGQVEGMVIQALRHLGQENIDEATIERLRQSLSTREKSALRREMLSAPGWLVPFLDKITEKAGKETTGKKLKQAEAA